LLVSICLEHPPLILGGNRERKKHRILSCSTRARFSLAKKNENENDSSSSVELCIISIRFDSRLSILPTVENKTLNSFDFRLVQLRFCRVPQ
jgi:hypothetical protein